MLGLGSLLSDMSVGAKIPQSSLFQVLTSMASVEQLSKNHGVVRASIMKTITLLTDELQPLFPMPPSWTRVSCLDKKTFDYAYKELVAAAEYNRKASGVQSIVLWELAKQSTATSAPSLDFPLPNADSHYISHLSRK